MGDRFIRFGEIPVHERSRNFLKMTNSEREDFTDIVGIGGYEQALKEVKRSCYEKGVSVFRKDIDGLPLLENLMQMTSLLARIGCKVYEVEAVVVGKGNDNEPLVRNIRVIKQRRIAKGKLLEKVLRQLIQNFRNVKRIDNKCCSLRAENEVVQIYAFYREDYVNIMTGEKKYWAELINKNKDGWVKMPPYIEYRYLNWIFSCPVKEFDVRLGIKNREEKFDI